MKTLLAGAAGFLMLGFAALPASAATRLTDGQMDQARAGYAAWSAFGDFTFGYAYQIGNLSVSYSSSCSGNCP